jgi:hypothetical protein
MTQRAFELPVLETHEPVDHARAAAEFNADVARPSGTTRRCGSCG